MFKKIILASQSPRRKQLLEMLGLPFEICVADIDETPPPEMPRHDVAVYLAQQKAEKVSAFQEQGLIIAADTIVLLGDEILGKPVDAQEAKAMLRKLSGSMHEVITGVALLKNGRLKTFSCTTQVYFNELEEGQIQHYVDHYVPLDKAGAYAIQEYIGLVGIRQISGDYYNVMGLPVCRLVKALRDWGIKL